VTLSAIMSRSSSNRVLARCVQFERALVGTLRFSLIRVLIHNVLTADAGRAPNRPAGDRHHFVPLAHPVPASRFGLRFGAFGSPPYRARGGTRLCVMSEGPSLAAANGEIRIVEGLLNALRDRHFDVAATLLDDDLVHETVGLSKVHGRRKALKPFEGRVAFDVNIHRIAANGAAVLTERTDALGIGPLQLQIWVFGVFEVRDGRITLWRDYVDFLEFFVKAPLRALVALPRVILAARRPQ
jgi:limonene-1,2-epoxide hydrolase